MKSTNAKAWYKTLKQNDEGCIITDNKPNQDGYTRIRCPIEKRLVMLHVFRWESEYGKKPEGMEINHKCNNRACCNIEHLELIDGSAHATLTNKCRVGYIMKRLPDHTIAEIYRKVKYEGKSINQMCDEYLIKRSTLSSIMNKRSRCSVTDEVDNQFRCEELNEIN